MNPHPSAAPSHSASGSSSAPPDFLFRMPTAAADPAIQRLCDLEEERQLRKLILIASESVCPEPVRQALGSSFNNLYTEGYPSWRFSEAENRDWTDFVKHLAYFRRYSDLRYYRGCDYANFAEAIAQKRIAMLFSTDRDANALARVSADDIHANVQPLSGAAANNAVYLALVQPGAHVVGMNLIEGGHLTHGSPANRSGKNYKIASYGVSPKTGKIDYDELQKLVDQHQPKMLIGGASAYPWHIDWKRMRQIADSVKGGCFLLADVAHYAGLIVAGQYPNPIGIADVVTFTTHKSLCGPRGACILTTDAVLAKKIDLAVFPGEQGGPHQGNIAAKAVAFHLAGTDTFRQMMKNVVANSAALAAGIEKRGLKIAYGGTQSHLCLVDLTSLQTQNKEKLSGEIAGRILDLAGIVVNKNTIKGDRSAVHPSAIRLGTVWMSQLGYDTKDMDTLAGLIVDTLKAIHPFHYLEGMGTVGRGKIDLDQLDTIRKGVDALIESRLGPPTGPISGYPHFDAFAAKPTKAAEKPFTPPATGAVLVKDGAAGVLEVESERAHYFMQSIGSADVSKLAPNECVRSAFFDRKGEWIDDALIVRQSDRIPGWRRYLVLTNPANHARLRRWFRAVSDGYVLFDDADVTKKVEGPVMVLDLSHAEPHAPTLPDPKIVSFTTGTPAREGATSVTRAMALIGPDAIAAFEQATGKKAPACCQAAGYDVGELCVLAARESDRVLHVLVDEAQADAMAQKLRGAAGVVAAGPEAVAHERTSQKLPTPGDSITAKQLCAAKPELFARTKVYVVGANDLPTTGLKDGKPWTWQPQELPLRQTPLFDEHLRLGQKEFMVPFGGWKMPVRYGSILEEHQTVRTAAGLFDVSHMGVLEFRGPHAARFLDAMTSNYVAWLRDGEASYGYLLTPTGHVLDDILVYRRKWDRLMVVVNAANAEKDEAWFRAAATGEYFLDDQRKAIRFDAAPEIVNLKAESSGKDRRVDCALQGPRSLDVLAAAANNPRLIETLRMKKRFELVEDSIDGIPAIIATTGYTGEQVGFEILVHPDHLVQLWKLLLDKGAKYGVKPVGLGARDSTRTEAGFPLWGHELAGDHEITPIEAGYGSSVKFHKPFFVGREAMLKHEQSRTREIVRFKIEGKGKRLVRTGNPVVGGDGKYVGVVTSNAQVSETTQIGLALVDRRSAVKGTQLWVYRLPANLDRLPAAKKLSELRVGDEMVLPEGAEVVKRFG